jgi:hypothetical protein
VETPCGPVKTPAATTAMIAGTSHQGPAPAQLTNLTKLGELMNAGLLTQAEFDQQKARILSG